MSRYISSPKCVVFLAFAFFYAALSPLSITGMGYADENIRASSELFENLKHLIRLAPSFVRVEMPRHGIFESVLELPFYAVGRLLGSGNYSIDRVLSLEPILATALICTILFVWVNKLTDSLRWAYVLTAAAGLTTMLWPYAYIGLETSQSLFLLLAAYLALCNKRRSWRSAVFFIFASALATSLKTAGLFVVPAVLVLGVNYFRDARFSRRWLWLAGFASAIALSCYTCQVLAARSYQYIGYGGRSGLFKRSVVSPTAAVFNLVSMICSANKGLLIYCPILLVVLFAARAAYRSDPVLTLFALLALGGIAGAMSFTFFSTDEVWGPRYLHSAVAPLIMIIAAGKGQVEFQLRRHIGIAGLMLVGFGVSLLGSFFSYHAIHYMGTATESLTLEKVQHSPEWNPIRFDIQLAKVWWHRSVRHEDYDQLWPPPPHSWSIIPVPPDVLKPASLRPYAVPQPFLLRSLPHRSNRTGFCLWIACLVSLVAGMGLLGRGYYLCFVAAGTSSGKVIDTGVDSKKAASS